MVASIGGSYALWPPPSWVRVSFRRAASAAGASTAARASRPVAAGACTAGVSATTIVVQDMSRASNGEAYRSPRQVSI